MTIDLGMPTDGPIADAIAHSVDAHGPKQTELKGKDFKTDQELGAIKSAYEHQLRLYARAVQAATGERAQGTLLII